MQMKFDIAGSAIAPQTSPLAFLPFRKEVPKTFAKDIINKNLLTFVYSCDLLLISFK